MLSKIPIEHIVLFETALKVYIPLMTVTALAVISVVTWLF